MTNVFILDGQRISPTDGTLTEAVIARVWDLYENHPRRKGRMPIFCGQDGHEGQHMYLQPRAGEMCAIHYPGEAGNCTIKIGRDSEGIPHKRFKAYLKEGLEAAGLPVDDEYRLGVGIGSTQLDLAVHGPVKFGIEVQFSEKNEKDFKSRTTRSTNKGYPPLWIPGTAAVANGMGYRIPMLRYNDSAIDWEAGMPTRGSLAALNVRRVTAQRCDARGVFDRCPDQPSGFCGQFHPWFNNMDEGWFALDDALGQFAIGDLVVLQDRVGVVRVVPAPGLKLYQELTGFTGELTGGKPRAVRLDLGPVEKPCTAERPATETLPHAGASPTLAGQEVVSELLELPKSPSQVRQNDEPESPAEVERTPLAIPRRTATFSPAEPDFFTKEPCWALQFGGYYPLLVVLLKAAVPSYARDWDATTKTWFIDASHVDALDTALRAHNCAVTGLTAPGVSRPPIPVRDVWSAAAERDRQFGEANRARIRNMRLDANGFVIQNGGVA